MDGIAEKSVIAAVSPNPAGLAVRLFSHRAPSISSPPNQRVACFHCGEPCLDSAFSKAERAFCCQGCLFVHDLLTESGLEQFYGLTSHPGVRVPFAPSCKDWAFLDEPALQAKLLDFTDGKISRITLHVPAIHCIACVWLLENLYRLLPGVGKSQVNFPRREVSVSFDSNALKLSQVVALLV